MISVDIIRLQLYLFESETKEVMGRKASREVILGNPRYCTSIRDIR